MSGGGGPWWAEDGENGLRFTCTRCGRCCKGPEPGFVRVGVEEIDRIRDALGLTRQQFGRRYLRRLIDGELGLTEHPNGDCIFWEDGAGCTIYEVRPDQCRTFPFWPEVLETRESWADYADMCPGMGSGRRYAPRRIRTILAGEAETRPGRKLPRRLETTREP